MIRLFLLGVTILIGTVVTVLTLFFVFAVIRWLKQAFFSSKKFVMYQYQGFKDRREKKLQEEQEQEEMPAFLRQARKRLKQIKLRRGELAAKWQLLLDPVIKEAQELVDRGFSRPDQAHSARGFFTVTLKALEGFIGALIDMNGVMQKDEEEKARRNIDVFMSDIYKYKAKLDSKKHFDFHVMMELVKQRLGK